MTSKDRNKKTNVNHKKIFGALEGIRSAEWQNKVDKVI